MSVDIQSCDIYALKYIFLKKANRKNTNSISYNMDQYSFFGHESKIFFQITLINVGIIAVYPRTCDLQCGYNSDTRTLYQ